MARNFCKDIFWLTSAIVVFIIVSPLVLILFVPLFLFRLTVRKLAGILRPDLDKILSVKSSVFTGDLFSRKAPRSSIVVQLVISGHMSEADFRKLVQHMVNLRSEQGNQQLLYPEFRQYIKKWCGYHFWKNDPTFEIGNHVKGHDNFKNKKAVTPEDIRGLMEDLLNKRFTHSRSPWEMYVVNNYIDQDLSTIDEGLSVEKTVLLIRFHHILCDGYSILHSMVGGALKTPLSQLQLPKPNFSMRKRKRLHFILKFPFRFISDLAHSLLAGLPDHSWKIPDSKKRFKQYYSRSKSIPIQKIKDIKKRFEVAFSSVLLSAISSSLAKGKSHGERIENGLLMIPLPLPNHPNALKNHATVAQIILPLKNYADPIQRLRDCDGSLKSQKNSVIPVVVPKFSKIFGQVPPCIFSKLMVNRTNIGGFTCFPVGSKEINLGVGNSKIESIDFTVGGYPGDAGVALSAVTYGPNIRFGVTVEAGLLSRKEVDRLMQLVEDEIDSLHRLIVLSSKKLKSDTVAIDMPTIINR